MNAFKQRVYLLLGLTILAAAAVCLVPRFAQPLWYHDFADQRPLLGIPHMMNVVSNLPFVLVGVWGVGYLLATTPLPGFRDPSERWSYVVFFAAVALTGVGSAYYHSHPDNDRLVWDRLPLLLACMTLLAILIAERIDRRVGFWMMVPLMLLGGGSVFYWHATESWGNGDLRAYLFMQLFPLLLALLILALFPARYTGSAYFYGALALYALAKVLELLDKPVFSLGQMVSGHTLKHLAAAMSPLMILLMIQSRHPLPGRRGNVTEDVS